MAEERSYGRTSGGSERTNATAPAAERPDRRRNSGLMACAVISTNGLFGHYRPQFDEQNGGDARAAESDRIHKRRALTHVP